ncbi:MAG: hypothetical protein CL931_12550 [Deltaproteobacteria bacterium]|nr:hypothetical protein [Deltaproteobacteria bacterium]
MAADIERETGIAPELVRGDGGIFDVAVDGDTIFSKHASGRYPEPGEILDALRR